MWDKFISSAFTNKTNPETAKTPAVLTKNKPQTSSSATGSWRFSIFPKNIPQTSFAPIDNQDTIDYTTGSISSRQPTPGPGVATGTLFHNSAPPARPPGPLAKELQDLANTESNSKLTIDNIEQAQWR